MTLVTFCGIWAFRPPASLLTGGSPEGLEKLRRWKMGGSGQQTGWIHLGDLTIAFVFPTPLIQTEDSAEQSATHKTIHGSA